MKLRIFVSFLSVLTLLLFACTHEWTLSLEEAKSMVFKHLKQDDTISDVEITKFELYEEKKDEKVFQVEYLIKPVNPDQFIIAGSRQKTEDNRIHAFEFVTINKNYEMRFSTSP